MAEPKMPAHGTICWTELATGDTAAAKKFYGELFGWEFKSSSAAGMEYTEYYADGRPWGGIYQTTPEMCEQTGEVSPYWMSYVAVDNVDESAARVESLGGQMIVAPTDIPNTGRFCIIADPTGAKIALITLQSF